MPQRYSDLSDNATFEGDAIENIIRLFFFCTLASLKDTEKGLNDLCRDFGIVSSFIFSTLVMGAIRITSTIVVHVVKH